MTQDSKESLEAFYKARGFGMQLGFGAKPALIVIDYTYAFTDSSTYLGSGLDAQLAQTNRLIDSAHEHAVPVIFTTVVYEDQDLNDAGIWSKKSKGVSLLRAGSKMVEIDARLHRVPTDTVLEKKGASAFFGTNLATRLFTHRVDTLVHTGCSTSGCVRATVIDTMQYGFRPIIAREAVGDRTAPAHEQSLFDMNAHYGDVVSVDECLVQFQRSHRTTAAAT
jgi:maleamate amidohydrolase